jgi:putative flippase GtrA
VEGADGTRGQLLRFGALGGVNTAVTAAAFYLLALVLPASVAFTIVYAAGIVFVALTTPRYVFRSEASWSRRAALAAWYVGVYLVGLGVVALLSWLDAPRVVVVIGTVCVTAPLSFLGARLLVSDRPARPEAALPPGNRAGNGSTTDTPGRGGRGGR